MATHVPTGRDDHESDPDATTEPFSDELQQWRDSDTPKTIGSLGEVFAERSFAITIMLLMLVPAVPLPTGGVTHVLEVVAVLVALQMVLGRDTIWIPARWRDRELGSGVLDKAVPFLIRRVRWFERFSRPRGTRLYANQWFQRFLGLVLGGLAVAAMFAPPFSGLDTLPAIGAVLIALSIVLEDIVILAIGAVIGTGGVVLIITVGAAIVRLLGGLF